MNRVWLVGWLVGEKGVGKYSNCLVLVLCYPTYSSTAAAVAVATVALVSRNVNLLNFTDTTNSSLINRHNVCWLRGWAGVPITSYCVGSWILCLLLLLLRRCTLWSDGIQQQTGEHKYPHSLSGCNLLNRIVQLEFVSCSTPFTENSCLCGRQFRN